MFDKTPSAPPASGARFVLAALEKLGADTDRLMLATEAAKAGDVCHASQILRFDDTLSFVAYARVHGMTRTTIVLVLATLECRLRYADDRDAEETPEARATRETWENDFRDAYRLVNA